MAEYIERQKLLDSIINRLGIKSKKYLLPAERVLYDEVENAPAADVIERKKGKWIHFSRSDECSVCGYDTGKYEAPTWFCPKCGADMR